MPWPRGGKKGEVLQRLRVAEKLLADAHEYAAAYFDKMQEAGFGQGEPKEGNRSKLAVVLFTKLDVWAWRSSLEAG